MGTDKILKKAIELESISISEGMLIYEQVPTSELMLVANECRKKQVPGNKVGWIIDRNVNITNVCISGCKFCNFHCKINEEVQYITTIDEYCEKTEELLSRQETLHANQRLAGTTGGRVEPVMVSPEDKKVNDARVFFKGSQLDEDIRKANEKK